MNIVDRLNSRNSDASSESLMKEAALEINRLYAVLKTKTENITDEQIIDIFETEIKNDIDAYMRPGECVYQITNNELIKSARTILLTGTQ